jgi:hypothetical protein
MRYLFIITIFWKKEKKFVHGKSMNILLPKYNKRLIVMVQFISVAFFFFITNNNSTFPLSLTWLPSINNPPSMSLSRFFLLGNAFESTTTVTLTFLVEHSPALPLGIVTCPTVTPWYMNVALVLSYL